MLEEHIGIILRIGELAIFLPDHSITSEKTLNEDYCFWGVMQLMNYISMLVLQLHSSNHIFLL
jgi:hypothetical protein